MTPEQHEGLRQLERSGRQVSAQALKELGVSGSMRSHQRAVKERTEFWNSFAARLASLHPDTPSPGPDRSWAESWREANATD